MRLAGKVAIVTGASSGIGRAIALAYAREGAAVVVAARDAARAGEVVDAIQAASGTAHFVEAHVEDVASCRALVARTVELHGRLDVLVNNAGILDAGPTEDVDEAAFDRSVAINVKGPFFIGQAAIPHMLEQGGGVIVNLSSQLATNGFPNLALYSLTKGAIHTLTRAWCAEYGRRGVRVVTLAPGTTETPMTEARRSDPDARAIMLGRIPASRFGRPDDLAAAAVVLASDEAAWVHGTSLLVDGGQSV
ncbi:MAG: glucose 1-dehydrogenase [Thermoleophilia bacterium]